MTYNRVLQLRPAPYAHASRVPPPGQPVALHHMETRHALPVRRYRRRRHSRRIYELEHRDTQPEPALVLDAPALLEVAAVVEPGATSEAAPPDLLEGERLDFEELEVARGRACTVQAVAEEDEDEQSVRVDVGRVPVCLECVDCGPLEEILVGLSGGSDHRSMGGRRGGDR